MVQKLWAKTHLWKLREKIKDENYQEKEDTSTVMSAMTFLPPSERRFMYTYKIILINDRTPNKST